MNPRNDLELTNFALNAVSAGDVVDADEGRVVNGVQDVWQNAQGVWLLFPCSEI